MEEAASRLAQQIGYRGAGTVEFLYDAAADRFFFLEMNTRLQVEHPVTELVWGVDLVEMQVAVAEGRSLGGQRGPSAGPDTVFQGAGHAIEVRLYAEDATYTPQSGRLLALEVDHDVAFGLAGDRGIRLDSGFASDDEVGTHYDAMLAKVVSWAPDRDQALRQLVRALRGARIHGITTNRDQLVSILTDEVFAAARDDDDLARDATDGRSSDVDRATVVAGALMLAADDAARRTVQQGIPAAWRNVVSQPQRTTFDGHDPVEWWGTRDGFAVDGMTVLEVSPTHVRLEVDGVAVRTDGLIAPGAVAGTREVWVDGPGGSVGLREVPRFTDPADAVASGSLLAPMPGTVVKVAVADGQDVAAGDVVLVLEAMKMQHSVTAPSAGTVTVNVTTGQQVASGEVLAVVEAAEGDTA